MKKIILIQARLSSSRFPRKMLHGILGIPLVEYVFKRCKESKVANDVAVITSVEKSDDALYDFCKEKRIPVFRGPLDDVLRRYIMAAKYYNSSIICRVCGDSPFVDYMAIDKQFIEFEKKSSLEYTITTNCLNGFISEAFTLNLIKKIYNADLTKDEKEHVTKYIRDNKKSFEIKELNLNLRPKKLDSFTLTVDYPEDIEIAEKIVSKFDCINFTSEEIIQELNNMKDENELQNT
mgnify:CR=1 FL=1